MGLDDFTPTIVYIIDSQVYSTGQLVFVALQSENIAKLQLLEDKYIYVENILYKVQAVKSLNLADSEADKVGLLAVPINLTN